MKLTELQQKQALSESIDISLIKDYVKPTSVQKNFQGRQTVLIEPTEVFIRHIAENPRKMFRNKTPKNMKI